MKRIGFLSSALALSVAAGCAQPMNSDPIDNAETDDRLFDFQFNINVTEVRDMDELTDKGAVVVSEARDDADFLENTGADPDEDDKYTVTGPAFRLLMPAAGKTTIEVSEEWGSGFGFDDVQFLLLLETEEGYAPRRFYFDTESLRTASKWPTNDGEHMAFAFETLEYDRATDSLTVKTDVDMTTETYSYVSGLARTTRDIEEKTLTLENLGWLETESLIVFPVPSQGLGNLVDSYNYDIKASCGTILQEQQYEIGEDTFINRTTVPAACSAEAQAEVQQQVEDDLEEGPVEPDPEADPEAPVDCGRAGTANADGGCDCPNGYAGPNCQYSDRSTCSGYGKAQDDGSCDCLASSNRTGAGCELYDCEKLNCDDGNSCTEETCTGEAGCSAAVPLETDECTEEDAEQLEEEAEEQAPPGNNSGGSSSGSGSGSGGLGSTDRPGDEIGSDDTPAAGGCAAGGSSNPATSLLLLLALAFMRRRRNA